MSKIACSISVSLDGFITGPNVSKVNPLGDGGERLHEWIYNLASWRELHGLEGGESTADSDVIQAGFESIGAVVMGRGMFDTGEEPWGEEPPFHMPVFVLTHETREPLVKIGTTFNFVNDGIQSAVAQAKAAAEGKDVGISGGADVIQQAIRAGLLDELTLHVVPVLLGDGTRLLDGLPNHIQLTPSRVTESPSVTHLTYSIG